VKKTRLDAKNMVRRTFLLAGPALFTGRSGLAKLSQVAPRVWNFGAQQPHWKPLEVRTGDTILVSAKVGGLPVRAILDSGSGATMLSTTLAAKLGIDKGERRTISGLSAKAPVQLVRDVDVSFGGEIRRLSFAVVADLTAASAAFGRPIDALLGADMFAGSCIALDFANKRLAVTKTGSFLGGADWRCIGLGRGSKQELLIRASIAGLADVPVMIDLGNSTALMLGADYVREQGLMRSKAASTVALGGVDGIKTNDIFTTPHLDIAGFGVPNVPTLVMRDWLPTSTVGNIGLPLIGQFDAVFDVSAEALWFRKLDPHHRLMMLKDRSGLGFAALSTALSVIHVAANSPAARGGWSVGDRIVAVNGHRINANYTSGDLWRWRFGSPKTIVKLTLASGEERELELYDYY
jgi:predicted aspartyl protease